MIHDRCYRNEGSQPWPTPTPDGDRHVGQDEYTVQREWQAEQLGAWIQRYPCLQLPGEIGVAAKREIDLRLVPTVWISMVEDSPASARIRTLLADAGFQHLQWSPGVAVKADRPVSRERLHAAGVALAYRQALLAHPGDGPLLLLEDDVALEHGIELNFAVPADADAVWVGVSRYGKPKIQPVNKQVSRISRMFSTHAVLYLSAAFKRHAIQCVEQCLDCHLPFDIALAFYQQDFNIYALNQPIFYQAAGADAAHHFEGLTRFSLAELP